ncbi:MAG TPA: hypothetical protein VFP24_04080 [Gaiellaceae bacterium]|nr:hypothetical protein [Gaiellaceae bacterium]
MTALYRLDHQPLSSLFPPQKNALTGFSLRHVLNNQRGRLIRVVVAHLDHAKRPVPQRDHVARPPVRTAVWNVGGSAGVPSSCSSL